MADQEDVRRVALSLPETVEGDDRFAFFVVNRGKRKAFAWVWMERLDPKKPRVPQPNVVAVRVANADEKDALLAMDRERFFTEPHYNGYPAVLVRLPVIDQDELEDLIIDAWRCLAPRQLVKEFDQANDSDHSHRFRLSAGTALVANYHFITNWDIDAPVQDVWDAILDSSRWPEWWHGVTRVEELERGERRRRWQRPPLHVS